MTETIDEPKMEEVTESGWFETKTDKGALINIFVFSAKDLKKLRPTDEDYERVERMLRKERSIKRKESTKEILSRIIKNEYAP